LEPSGRWPWDAVAICGILVAAAYAIGSTSPSQDKPQALPELKRDAAMDEEIDRLKREQEEEHRRMAAQTQEAALRLQAEIATREIERRSFQERQADLEGQLRDTAGALQLEREARKSQEEKLRDSIEEQRELEREYKDLKRRFEEEMSSLRASIPSATYEKPSPRVQAYPMGRSAMQTPREARIEEWRRRFQRGQEARDAYNAWLEAERESDFLSAASRIDIENGGKVDWPELLLGPAFASHRSQIELAVRTGDLKMLNAAADGALVLLENRARQFGRSMEGYIAAKRFLTVVKGLSL
jgi:hypothetical protein